MSRKKRKKEELEKRQRSGSRKDEDSEADDYAMWRPNLSPLVKRWISGIVIFALALLSILALANSAGVFGNYLHRVLSISFGWSAYVFPAVLIVLGYFLLTCRKRNLGLTHYIGFVFLVLSISGLLHLLVVDAGRAVISEGRGGGYLGYGISYSLIRLMGKLASFIILLMFFLISILIIFESWIVRIKENGWESKTFWQFKNQLGRWRGKLGFGKDAEEVEPVAVSSAPEIRQAEVSENRLDGVIPQSRETPAIKKIFATRKTPVFEAQPRPTAIKTELPFNLLSNERGKATSGDIEASKIIIQKTLSNFGISVDMGEVSVGPTVTQYTLKPAEGVKLAQITTLQNDLSLALAAHPLRIEAPIPGKSLVGVEVPNKAVAKVTLREILEHEAFKQRQSNFTVVLGKDVAGLPFIADLVRMPHMLVAGATGSGKTVCLNTIIVSLLYQNTPEELRFIMVDPKRVELTAYNGIPHLLSPAITEVQKTINALKWAVGEMERRFHVLSEASKRDIHAYNAVAPEIMPYIVIVVDELADLMSASAAEVEALIIRLAQMARAVGIHLILATQRPSVDVITGLIKANITTRVAFSVASIMDSRTILDSSGAEKLLGRGDMLYTSAEFSKPKRLQGAFLSDREVENVVHYLRERSGPDYNEEVVSTTHAAGNFGGSFGVDVSGGDELLDQAKETVILAGKASASLLQRRLRVGYARAARLLDLLEEQGVIGPADGAKPRDILIDATSGFGQSGFDDSEEIAAEIADEINNKESADDLVSGKNEVLETDDNRG